ncbi:hypothetical protein LTR62_006701 [Meristemomyces frigidus]|uniref:Major facilitator superfamily (MFS) profile domain-containing protein n=1 Tax=Meristemomyces frigidus TaxID=1508187 RepID=A0AAN7TNT9_9PEZI|nr:hypothetical protein LTR62_006701 [Meristemomyces frigidus]
MSLDVAIISTAIPRITDEFNSTGGIGWYGSAFLMTAAAFQTMWDKVYKYFSIKWTFLLSILIFAVGSLICALAPTNAVLVVGRAIAGVGVAGISAGSYLLVGISAPPKRALALMGVTGAAFTLLSVAGPLIVNFPIGALSLAIIVVFFTVPAHAKPTKAIMREVFLSADIGGTIILLTALACFLLAMQWGGTSKAWSSASVVATFVLAAALGIAFEVLEWRLGERAAINGRLLKNKTIAWQMAFQGLVSGTFFVLLYYLPIYFQSVKGVLTSESGIRNIPMMIGSSLFAIVTDILISIAGEYQASMVVGNALICIASDLIYTLDVVSQSGEWIGYQVIAGIGMGLSLQIGIIVSQGVVEPQDMSEASAMALFFQLFSGAIAVSVAQVLFANKLLKSLTHTLGHSKAVETVAAGATGLRRILAGADLDAAIHSYKVGLRNAYMLSIVLAGLGVAVGVLSIIFDRRTLGKGKQTTMPVA